MLMDGSCANIRISEDNTSNAAETVDADLRYASVCRSAT